MKKSKSLFALSGAICLWLNVLAIDVIRRVGLSSATITSRMILNHLVIGFPIALVATLLLGKMLLYLKSIGESPLEK